MATGKCLSAPSVATLMVVLGVNLLTLLLPNATAVSSDGTTAPPEPTITPRIISTTTSSGLSKFFRTHSRVPYPWEFHRQSPAEQMLGAPSLANFRWVSDPYHPIYYVPRPQITPPAVITVSHLMLSGATVRAPPAYSGPMPVCASYTTMAQRDGDGIVDLIGNDGFTFAYGGFDYRKFAGTWFVDSISAIDNTSFANCEYFSFKSFHVNGEIIPSGNSTGVSHENQPNHTTTRAPVESHTAVKALDGFDVQNGRLTNGTYSRSSGRVRAMGVDDKRNTQFIGQMSRFEDYAEGDDDARQDTISYVIVTTDYYTYAIVYACGRMDKGSALQKLDESKGIKNGKQSNVDQSKDEHLYLLSRSENGLSPKVRERAQDVLNRRGWPVTTNTAANSTAELKLIPLEHESSAGCSRLTSLH